MIHALNSGAFSARIPREFLRQHEGKFWVDQAAVYRYLVDNAVLREDAAREVQEAVTRVARRDLVAVADVRAAGLTVTLRNIGVTLYEFDRITPVGEATQSMSILNLGDRDLVTFIRGAVPVPVTASQFEMDARMAAAGGGANGGSVSMTNIEEHTRSVAEKLEDTLVNGSDVVLDANTLPGYTTLSTRETLSFTQGAWSSATGLTGAIADVIAARGALRDNGFTGPYILYLPTNFDGVLDDDYKAESDRTLRERLLAMDGIAQVKVLPSLADDNVLLVQMTRSVVEMPIGQDITTVTWDLMGGLATRWAILGVITFALKASAVRNPLSAGVLPALTTGSGIVHIS